MKEVILVSWLIYATIMLMGNVVRDFSIEKAVINLVTWAFVVILSVGLTE